MFYAVKGSVGLITEYRYDDLFSSVISDAEVFIMSATLFSDLDLNA